MTTTDNQTPKDITEASSSAGVSCAAAAGSPLVLSEITQRLIDPVHGGYVDAVHVEDARMILAENKRLRSTIYHLTDTLGFAVDMAKANHAALIAEVDRRMTPTKANKAISEP